MKLFSHRVHFRAAIALKCSVTPDVADLFRVEKMVAGPQTSLNPPAVRRFLQIVTFLLLLTAVIGGRYLYHRGLTKPWREYVVEEIRKHGVEMEIGRLTVRPFRGLVAKDVKIFDSPARNRVLARVSGMVVEANYANAARGRAFLDALTLLDTNLRIPLDPKQPGGPAVDVANLSARILFPPNQIHVSHLDAVVLGVHVRASGSLTIPAGASMFPDKEGTNPERFTSLMKELSALRFEGGPPDLTMRFSGDASQPQGILVEAELSGQKIRRGAYTIASLAVAANWQNNVLLIPRFDAADSVGRLEASGSYDPRSRAANFRVRSGLDLPALTRAFALADTGDFTFQSAPQLDLTARMELGDTAVGSRTKYQVLGQARLGKFTFRKVQFQDLNAAVSWDGRRWAARDVVLRHASGGEIRGDAQQDFDAAGNGDFRIGLTSNLKPQVLATMLGPEAAARLALIKLFDAPRLTLSARGASPDLDTISAAGELRLGRTSYRGVEAKSASTRFRYKGRVLSLDSFDVARTEGGASGGLAFDFEHRTVQIKQVRSTVFPVEVVMWVDPGILPEIKPYRFGKTPPSLVIDGILDTRKGGTRTRLTVVADAPAGMDYTFAGKELRLGDVKGRLFFTDERLKLSETRAELFGGRLIGNADISLLKAKPGHTATVQLSGVNFAKLSKLYFDYDESEGKIDGTYTFTGRGDEARTMRGEGELTVTDGNVFAIPFLGPFSEILAKVFPGVGYNRAHKASASFGIADGIITTKNFLIAGKEFSMLGGGRIWFLEDKMDFDIRINAQGFPGTIFLPVSKLLEYRSVSKFSKPEWRPKIIPRLNPIRQ